MSHSSADITPGIVELNGDSVVWHNEDVVFLQFNITDIIAIGECTNSNGPWVDDWYITFVFKNGQWVSIPQYAWNMEQLVDYLCEKFDPMLNQYQLANSTDWKSVVSFPVDLRGKELFQLEPSRIYKEPRNLFQKFLFYLGMRNFETSKEIMLSEEIKNLTNKKHH